MINIRVPDSDPPLHPRITVIGVGGAGGNAVNNMIRANLEGVEFLVCNTDAQALNHSAASRRIQLGLNITRGLGAGSRPDVGRAAAEEALEELFGYLEGSNMVFITAGMGGGTGTGAAPVIARAAREHNILTVGVVTKPFQFEGAHRMRTAEAGIQELQQYVDTLIVIPNQNLFRIANEKTTFADAFKMADEVLHSGVRGVTDLMVMPGLINLDFADIRTVMSEMGKAMMGTGEAEGQRRAIDAAEAAISNPLLDEVSLKGARAMLINITAGMDIALFEVDEAVNRVRAEVDPEANVIFGSTFDPTMEGRLRVSVVATGIDAQNAVQPQPISRTPDLNLIRGGADGLRKQTAGLGGNPATSWPGTPAVAAGRPLTMGATARQLDPVEMALAEPQALTPEPEPPQPVPAPPKEVAAPVLRAESEPAPVAPPRPAAIDPALRANPHPRPQMQPAPAPVAAKKSGFTSLLERMTGAGRRAEQPVQQPLAPPLRANPTFGANPTFSARPTVRPAEPEAGSMPGYPTFDPGATQPNVTPTGLSQVPLGHLGSAQAGGTQARLGIDPPARPKMSSPEDDLLEIPAFLRRQAN